MTSPGQESIWPSCVLSRQCTNFASGCEKFIKNKYFYWLDSFLYHSSGSCNAIKFKCFVGKVSDSHKGNLSLCLGLAACFGLRSALLYWGRPSLPMQLMLACRDRHGAVGWQGETCLASIDARISPSNRRTYIVSIPTLMSLEIFYFLV